MKVAGEPVKNSRWGNIFNISDDDFLRIFLPIIDDEEQRRLEEEEDEEEVNHINDEDEE